MKYDEIKINYDVFQYFETIKYIEKIMRQLYGVPEGLLHGDSRGPAPIAQQKDPLA